MQNWHLQVQVLTRWWLDCVETLKTRSGTKDFGEMCIWSGTNLPHKTPETIGRNLLELERCLDVRLTISDKAVAYVSDKGTEEHEKRQWRKISVI